MTRNILHGEANWNLSQIGRKEIVRFVLLISSVKLTGDTKRGCRWNLARRSMYARFRTRRLSFAVTKRRIFGQSSRQAHGAFSQILVQFESSRQRPARCGRPCPYMAGADPAVGPSKVGLHVPYGGLCSKIFFDNGFLSFGKCLSGSIRPSLVSSSGQPGPPPTNSGSGRDAGSQRSSNEEPCGRADGMPGAAPTRMHRILYGEKMPLLSHLRDVLV
jgi:hypothetical protein